jgi:large conductance mechanosensitive channel
MPIASTSSGSEIHGKPSKTREAGGGTLAAARKPAVHVQSAVRPKVTGTKLTSEVPVRHILTCAHARFHRREWHMLKEFKEFALRGNVVDMAVGIVIGGAFGTIVSSLVNDVLMPPIGLAIGGVDFSSVFAVLSEGMQPGPYATVAAAKEAGAVTLNVGVFINAVISFLIVAFALFMVVKGMNAARRQDAIAPSAPPPPTPDQRLLTEIRDLLAARRA